MKVPVSWLREYVAFTVPLPELAERLAVSSCEVERIERRGVPDTDGNLGLFRVGRVVEAGKHPNADRLQLCRVDVGEGEPRQIVCGAWNFGAGATVAVALPGAVLPGGMQLGEAKLRGELSSGMILSERELELGPDHTGIIVLEDESEPGAPLADVLPLAEDVLDLEVTGNRPDLLAVYGIAREVAALYDLPLAPMPGVDPPRAADEPVDVRIEELEACPRLHRPALPRRRRRAVAAVAARAADRGRDAADLERRRRDELRDDRARQPDARVRPRDARRGPDRRPLRPWRRGAAHARRDGAYARSRRSRDRRRRARRRGRRDHGRRGDGGHRADDLRPARGRELRAARDPAQLGAAQAAHGRLQPLGEGRRPAPRRARRAPRVRS